MLRREWMVAPSLSRSAWILAGDLIMIADQGSHAANLDLAAAVDQLADERAAVAGAAAATAAARRFHISDAL